VIPTPRDVKIDPRMSNMIASAVVVVPEPETFSKQPSPSLKWRQSSLDSESSKRPRLDTRISQQSNDDSSPTSVMSPPRRKSSAIGSGAAEERKRGQRLFGALLGTLSQTSAKPAHRRRDEIEKRQQDKLRQKDEELADEKRRKREELDAARRKEQKVWDRQGVRNETRESVEDRLTVWQLTIKHQNMRATAHFLKTKAEPSLVRLFHAIIGTGTC
jgi:pinin/SDK/memA/ protein conserved region